LIDDDGFLMILLGLSRSELVVLFGCSLTFIFSKFAMIPCKKALMITAPAQPSQIGLRDRWSMLHRISNSCLPRLRQFIPRKAWNFNNETPQIQVRTTTHLSCTLNSSSMSSSSQLSSQSLSPPDFAAPGVAPPRCARSVCESSQSMWVESSYERKGGM
jgi:hypothetical protein